jgi:hypothetical protein
MLCCRFGTRKNIWILSYPKTPGITFRTHTARPDDSTEFNADGGYAVWLARGLEGLRGHNAELHRESREKELTGKGAGPALADPSYII